MREVNGTQVRRDEVVNSADDVTRLCFCIRSFLAFLDGHNCLRVTVVVI